MRRRRAIDPAARVMERLEALARITDEPGRITRSFASPAMRRVNDLVAQWMKAAGMSTQEDAVGNLLGHYAGEGPKSPRFLLGSHLDTVPNAGKYDGLLGVVLGIACVEALRRNRRRLPFALEVIGFADEEGVRYQTAYLGSKAVAGTLSSQDLKRTDANGITLADAIRRFGGDPRRLRQARLEPDQVLGYLEAHIEQGPVLEQRGLAVGVVEGIAGQSRLRLCFRGTSGHAGTVPMEVRHDALAGAAEFVLAVEKCGARVATVGRLEVEGGASNVIPGCVHLTLDVRDPNDQRRHQALRALRAQAQALARRRGLRLDWTVVQETNAVRCDPAFSRLLARSIAGQGIEPLKLPSGAGHDAAVMAKLTRTAMLFIRCKKGVSHHPDESVRAADVRVALRAMNRFIEQLAQTA